MFYIQKQLQVCTILQESQPKSQLLGVPTPYIYALDTHEWNEDVDGVRWEMVLVVEMISVRVPLLCLGARLYAFIYICSMYIGIHVCMYVFAALHAYVRVCIYFLLGTNQTHIRTCTYHILKEASQPSLFKSYKKHLSQTCLSSTLLSLRKQCVYLHVT